MRIREWIEDEVGALVIAMTVAVFSAIGAFMLAVFVSTTFVRCEEGFWCGYIPGLPVALIVGVIVFVFVFLRVRSH